MYQRFYVRGRKTRAYPNYFVVKRAWRLRKIANIFYASEAARRNLSHEKGWHDVRRIACGDHARVERSWRSTGFLLRAILKRQRLFDVTRISYYPQLVMILIDLRNKVRGIMEVEREGLQIFEAPDADRDEQWEAAKKTFEGRMTTVFKLLVTKWSMSAFLCDPYHIEKYRAEVAEHGHVAIPDSFDDFTFYPTSLNDTDCYRKLTRYAVRAINDLAKTKLWPGIRIHSGF